MEQVGGSGVGAFVAMVHLVACAACKDDALAGAVVAVEAAKAAEMEA